MSLWRDELTPSQATSACLVVLAAIAIASMARVIDPGYLGWAIGGVVLGAVFAFAFGQRSLGVGFGLLIVLAGLSLPALFLRSTDVSTLPTPDAFSAIRKLIASGFAGIAKDTPPVAAVPKYTILVWISFLLLGFLGAAWVVVRRPVGAVVSALAVLTFTGSVGEGGGRTAYAVAAIAATGGFFLAEGRHRIARWGGGRIRIPGWLGLPTLGAACALAIGAPLVLGESPILKVDTPLRPRVVIIKPLSDIKRQLKVDPPQEVMRVQSNVPTYWRLTSLDAYDGREWVLEAHPRDVRSGIVPLPDGSLAGDVIEQSYRLTSLLSPWLPAAYAATSVDTDAAVQVDTGSQTLLLRDKSTTGLAYDVRSRQPRVTQNLTEEPHAVDDDRERLFGALAQRIVGDARTPLDKARRLESHFKTYRYDEDVPGGHTVARLQQFLKAKTGYCEQFAATMTLMLRGLGVEARVGVGFLPGAEVAGEYIVSTRDAHAWVEADIPGAGWASFDPTPGRGAAGVAPEELPGATTPEPLPRPTLVPDPTPQQQPLPEDVTEPDASSFPLAPILYVLLGLAVIGAAPAIKAMRRSGRRRGTPDAIVVGAYAELVDRARDLGWRPRASETQREFVARSLRGDEHALRLALLTARALYGPGTSEREDARSAWLSSGVAAKNLARRAPWWRRVLAFADIRTFLPDRPLVRARMRLASALGRS